MFRIVSLLPILFFLLFSLFETKAFAEEDVSEILYINSYHNGYFWSDGVTEGIKNTLKNSSNYVLNIEYLDAKKDPNYYKDPLCINYFERKYTPETIDLIITSDNDALDFILMNLNHSLFRNKKIVACGISNIEAYQTYENLYLVKEITTFEETIDIMTSFFPDMEKLIFISDNLSSGRIYIEQVSQIIDTQFKNIELEVWDCIDLNTLAKRVSRIKFPSVLFYSTVNNDCNNQTVNEYDVAEIIGKNTRAPLFSGHYTTTTKGFIGGCMTTGLQNGKMAGNLAIDLLIDNKKNIKKITIPEVITVFDHKSLTKFRIPKKLIPNNSIILDKPENFWKRNKKLLSISFLIILQLFIVIGLLYRSVIQQKKFEKKLIIARDKAKESNTLKSIFLENISHEMRTPLNSIVGFSDVLSDVIIDK
ncbi:MAG: hypothetical protein PF541_03505, partial [Prolixibacteraceae bacterium]|nr:hypothetical protein [Prolixibacteraceae bacterium]